MVNTKRKLNILFAGIVSVTSGVVAYFRTAPEVEATACSSTSSVNPCDANFNVNVVESLSVTITTPSTWASGNVNTFLRNKVNLVVTTSNSAGYTASMYSSDSTNLSDGADTPHTISTLSAASARSDFPVNRWGYSLGTANSVITTAETDAGNTSAVYAAMTTSTSTPITIKQSSTAVSEESTNIYFGTKADLTQAAGTYSGDVIISVVTGAVSGNNPVTPTNPTVDTDDTTAGDNTPTYVSTKNSSVSYSGTSSSTGSGYTGDGSTGDTTTVKTTEIIEGEYTDPLGVTTTTTATSVTSNNNALATGLAVTATVASASGILFFIAGKRDDDDDEEEA